IQDYINKPENQYLLSEFEQQLNSTPFKQAIANALSISPDAIGNITFTNDLLKIQPNTLFKFIPESPNNIVVNENIQIQNLMFYTGRTFVDLQLLYNVINNYIIDSSRKFTPIEFSNNIPQNLDSLKLLIVKNLKTSNANPIGIDEIEKLSLNSDNNFVITLNKQIGNYFKYSIQENDNIILEDGNKLVIKNLTYYTDITISDDALKDLWTNINNFIKNNQITVGSGGNISSYLNFQIYDFFKNVKTVNNQNLSEFIDSPINSNASVKDLRTISVRVKNGLYKMTSKNLNDSDIVIENNNNLISMKNLFLASPDTYFNWNSNKITSLTSVGLNQNMIILPEKAEQIGNQLFMNNQKIQQLDMSCSQIEELPSNTTDTTGLFYMSNNLTYLYLPKNLKVIGERAFYRLSGLAELVLPNTLTTIKAYAFSEAPIKNGIIRVPGSVKVIEAQSFSYLKILNIYFEEGVETIESRAMLAIGGRNIYFPNSIKNIGDFAFADATHRIQRFDRPTFFVKSEEMITKFINMHLFDINSSWIQVKNW
ncbi:MAG: leucine-rich repeat domain-containing protein, partial [Ureaplasma sp.]|nr:leucine-rich repeat domain-containing protein [Ureaplasma sp.]